MPDFTRSWLGELRMF